MKTKLPFLFWLIAITVASLLPSDSLPEQTGLFPGADKVIHMIMYAGLSIFARMAFSRLATAHAILCAVALSAYGLLLEILQPVLSSRSFELADIFANTAGVVLGMLLASIPYLRRKSSRS